MTEIPTPIENILIVCVGNICRSPLAEAVMRDALKGTTRYSVSSAGLGAVVGFPAAAHAQALMAQRGLDISTHSARQLTPDLIDDSDIVLVMERSHKQAIEQVDVSSSGKVFRLGHWQNQDIPDPYQQPMQAFEETLRLVDLGVRSWVEKLKPGTPSNNPDKSAHDERS